MKLKVGHLYPELMNIYADRGNVECLRRRCEWRGIAVEVRAITAGGAFAPDELDIILLGGGQDRQQRAASEDLQEATAVWFNGGRQWRLTDAYLNTLTYREFHEVLVRGGVIGGSSAGATIQGSYLVRGAPEGNQIMMSPGHEESFGFLKNSGIDQHIDTRNRWSDLYEVIMAHPELLGIGISESTAIVVTGDVFEVIGRGQVAIHDARRTFAYGDTVHYFTLDPGDRFDIVTRQRLAGTDNR